VDYYLSTTRLSRRIKMKSTRVFFELYAPNAEKFELSRFSKLECNMNHYLILCTIAIKYDTQANFTDGRKNTSSSSSADARGGRQCTRVMNRAECAVFEIRTPKHFLLIITRPHINAL